MMILDLLKSELKSEPKLRFPRCQHRSPAGRQCSQPTCSTSPHFCFTHKPDPEELTVSELTAAAGSLSTPQDIHNFLACVAFLRIRGRITPKEATSYAYPCQVLQRGMREIAFHQKLSEERAEHLAAESRRNQALQWSLPRPDRSDPPTTATTGVTESSATPCPPVAADPVGATPPCPPPPAEYPKPAAPLPAPSTISPKSSTAPAIPREFFDHFFPIDPSLPPGMQDVSKQAPHPNEAECERRNVRRGFLPSRLSRKASARFFGLWR